MPHSSGRILAVRPRGRLAVLFLLLLVSASLYHWLSTVAPPSNGSPLLFLPVWSICFLPYFLACAYVLTSRPLLGRWRWIELGVLLLGALVFRAMLVPLPPGLSRDVWRYLWDARVVLHGYSPYVYAPGARALEPLRNILFTNCRFRNIPTDYPPGAEDIFLLGYLLDPQSLAGIKVLFLAFDLTTCGALAWLLARRGIDPRVAIIYAWCPLPIVEFAIEGHLDVVAIAFMVLAVLSSTHSSRNARIATGFFLGLATLTRLYPILLLPLLLRRRDWPLVLTFVLTLLSGYLPFVVLGHGQVLGFLTTYAGQQGGNAGIVQAIVRWVSAGLRLGSASTLDLEYAVDVLLLVAVAAVVLMARRRIGVETAILLLIGTVFAISSHVFPWYVPALLPWIALSIRPVLPDRWSVATGVAAAIAWYVACTALLSYTNIAIRVKPAPWWGTFFYVERGFVIILAVAAAILLIYACLSLPALRKPWSWVKANWQFSPTSRT